MIKLCNVDDRHFARHNAMANAHLAFGTQPLFYKEHSTYDIKWKVVCFFIRNNTGYRWDKTILGKSEIREILVIHNCLHKYFVNIIQLLVNSK
jgi:hypothetical protein